MDVFSVSAKPDWGFSENPESNVVRVQLGDGYVYREPVGINFRTEGWAPTWSNLTTPEALEKYQFLRLRKSLTPFLWQHPLSGVMYQVTCEAVTLTYDTYNNAVLSATFQRDFNPQA